MDVSSKLTTKVFPVLAALMLFLAVTSSTKTGATPGRSRSRLARSDDFSVHVSVRPKIVEFGPNEIIAVNCRVNGGTSLTDVPYVKFYRKLGDETHMPLSSGDPGVLVRSMPGSYGLSGFNKTIKTLYLGNKSWLTMDFGDNMFYCRGSNNHGRSSVAYFVVRKVWYPNGAWSLLPSPPQQADSPGENQPLKAHE